MTDNELALGRIRARLPTQPEEMIVDPYYVRVSLGEYLWVVFIREFVILDAHKKVLRHVYCEDIDEAPVQLPELLDFWTGVEIIERNFIIKTKGHEIRIDLDLQIESVTIQDMSGFYLTYPEHPVL